MNRLRYGDANRQRRRYLGGKGGVRVLKISTFALVSLFLVVQAVQAQTPQPQRPTPRETPRPATGQNFLGWLRQFAPAQHRQSRAASVPPLPRPRPAELAPRSVEPSPVSEEPAPASGRPDQTPAEVAPAPPEPNGPLND
jgi:hypothetical protein